jgi:hypothetical protein
MNTFNPAFNDLKINLKDMLLKGIHSFEDGFEILDIDLEMDENLAVDVLAKDSKGNPTVVLMADVGEEDLMHRTLNTLCHLRKFRFLLQRIYKDHAFDFSVPPRILLLSSRFSDDFIEKLDFIVAGEIVPYEYSLLKIEGKEFLTFTRRDMEEGSEIRAFPVAGKAPAPPPKEPEPVKVEVQKPASEPVEAPKPAPKSAPEPQKKGKKKQDSSAMERFFHEAKKKILRISNDIVEVVEEPYSRFKINNRVLVTLSNEGDDFSVYLGDTNDKRLKIQSEDQLNDALNQIFKRYFTTFSSISKT